MYIQDTRDFPEHFKGKSYRCILSMPVKLPNGNIAGIINVDADEPGFFGNPHEAHQHMASELQPLVNLMYVFSVR